MARKRREVRGVELERDATYTGISAEHVTVTDCWSAWGPADTGRPRFEGISIKDLQLRDVALNGAILKDVHIDGLDADGQSMLFDALQLEHVTLRGPVTTAIFNPCHPSREYDAEYVQVIREHEKQIDWTLDISDAVGMVEIRGHDAERIIRNPVNQALVRRAEIQDGRWRDLDLGRSGFGVTLQMFSEQGWDNTILCADQNRTETYESSLRALDTLRAEGIADQE